MNSESIVYDKDMIETWLNIVALRNMEPVHTKFDGSELKRVIEFFGLKLSRPQNYSLLWERILDKFRFSLEVWLDLLNELNRV